eukprot:11707687-Alexandrium_andersonii.AAC.1
MSPKGAPSPRRCARPLVPSARSVRHLARYVGPPSSGLRGTQRIGTRSSTDSHVPRNGADE